jgi:predicted ribosome quality control (RQC) complex YloA/Tae2 family protein
MQKSDIYFHATIHGAASVLLKNPTGLTVSPISIQQAAEFSIARSSAWKSDEVCSTYWIYDHQVKKSLSDQPSLPTSAFYIVGKKNEIECHTPNMGLGILFHATEEYLSKHIDERKMKIES